MLVCGLDIGGTKLGACAAWLDPDGRVQRMFEREFATDTASPPGPQLRAALDALDDMVGEGGTPSAIGVSCPGPYSKRTGVLLDVPNMPSWQNFNIAGWFEAAGRRATIMNDANAGALAEWRWGGFDRPELLVFLTMSTGLGAGIVVNGRVLEGPNGFAGEVGRVRLREYGPVGFGAFGTAEGFASGPGLVQLALAERLRRRQSGEATSLFGAELTPALICEHAANGDEAASAVVRESAAKLGELVAILANVLEPSVFVLGTIGARHPELFIPVALQHARRHCHRQVADSLVIQSSTLEHRWQHQAIASALSNPGASDAQVL
ncbi:MAG: ROK family protein [Planctomycetota bacterium]